MDVTKRIYPLAISGNQSGWLGNHLQSVYRGWISSTMFDQWQVTKMWGAETSGRNKQMGKWKYVVGV